MRSVKTILRDPQRTGQELGRVMLQNLKCRVTKTPLIVDDEYISKMANELPVEERDSFSLYAALNDTLTNLFNLMHQIAFKFDAGYNVLKALIDKLFIRDTKDSNADSVPPCLSKRIDDSTESLDELYKIEVSDDGKSQKIASNSYDLMFSTISFLEAANVYLKTMFKTFRLNGFDCFFYDLTRLYSLSNYLMQYTLEFYKILTPERVKMAQTVFFVSKAEITPSDFQPEKKDVLYLKHSFISNPDTTIRDFTTKIVMIQKTIKIGEEQT